jgi:hypothetical protein
LRKYLGKDFPGFDAEGTEWKSWIKTKMQQTAGQRQTRNLHYTRHDHFRAGRHWISSRDSRGYREPQSDKNALKPVLNLITPALNFRLGVLSEQHPGFAFTPMNADSAGREIAEAQQTLVEYEFFRQRAWTTFLDAMYWTQTHGVAFVEVYVDKTAGKKHEASEVIPEGDERFASLADMGYQVTPAGVVIPLDESGNWGEPEQEVETEYEGELKSRIVLANELIIDPEARTINGPQEGARWLIKRKARDAKNVRQETGDEDLRGDSLINEDSNSESIDDTGARWQRGLPPFPTSKSKAFKEIVWEYSIYFAPDKNALPDGAWLQIIDNKIIDEGQELPGGVIPFARFTDGTPDPQMFPRPEISDWIPDQTAINALLKSALDEARLGGARILARKNTVLEETYTKIIGSLLEYQGEKPEFIKAAMGNSDIMNKLFFYIGELEKKDGWTPMARGQVTGNNQSPASMQDVSGRAVLGAKEMMERAFGPMIRAAAEGTTQWAEIVVALSKYTLSQDKLIPKVGRPDLAVAISKEKLGESCVVYCDPETMMPVPRTLKEQILLQQYQMQLIDKDEYQSKSPYADVRNLQTGNTAQYERAKQINLLIEERHEKLAVITDPVDIYGPMAGMTVLWQDTPMIHKKVLLELILNERKPWAVRKIANDRWGIYDQLERSQMDQTGQWPIPPEVIGVPPDKLTMQNQQMQQAMAAAPVQQQEQQSQPTQPQPAVLPTSPTSDMTAGGPSAASTDAAQPLGSFGDVERAAEGMQS